MVILKSKLEIALARQCKSLTDLRENGLSPKTLSKAAAGVDISTKSAGTIARALNVDVSELVKEGGI